MATYTIKRRPGEERTYRIDYRGELNDAQYEAATALAGPVLVVAGAGSGKTRTLTYRVARLVESGVPARSILLLTFTRRAAQEMLRRAEALLDGGVDEVTGGTFHSFANTMLRRYAKLFGWPEAFTILDRADSEDAINLCRAQLGFDRKDRRFPRKQTLATIFSTAVNRGVAIADLVDAEYFHLAEDTPDILRCHETYAAYKRERALLDYDDLLVHLRDRLADTPEFAERLGTVYRYVMVDEYQDTNKSQLLLVRHLVAEHGNLCVVGDDDQSIYAWRGAEPGNILDFEAHFPGARRVTLDQNYRSTPTILAAANAVIANNGKRHEKRLFTDRPDRGLLQLLVCPDPEDEARFVAEELDVLKARKGYRPGDCAILYRSNIQARPFEEALKAQHIEYRMIGGQAFFERKEVKDAIAYSPSKWAVRGLTRSAALDLAPYSIRVNSVHPGLTDTPIFTGFPQEVIDMMTAALPIPRLGRPEEIAAVIAFLASDGASFCTGSEFTADGGYACA